MATSSLEAALGTPEIVRGIDSCTQLFPGAPASKQNMQPLWEHNQPTPFLAVPMQAGSTNPRFPHNLLKGWRLIFATLPNALSDEAKRNVLGCCLYPTEEIQDAIDDGDLDPASYQTLVSMACDPQAAADLLFEEILDAANFILDATERAKGHTHGVLLAPAALLNESPLKLTLEVHHPSVMRAIAAMSPLPEEDSDIDCQCPGGAECEEWCPACKNWANLRRQMRVACAACRSETSCE